MVYLPPKRGQRRRAKKKRIIRKNRPKKPLTAPGIYRFKREMDELVLLEGTPDSWTLNSDNSLAKTFAFALSSLGDHSDFQNLFKYYRIKGARVRMYFSNTSSRADQGTPAEPDNKQIMVQIDRNMDGVGVPTLNDLLTSQTKRRFVALQGTRKPSVDVYMPLKQAMDVYSTAGTPTTLSTPKWLSTAATGGVGVPHYGHSINLGRIDRRPFTTGMGAGQYVRIITTLYIECKKVQ